VWFYGKEHRLCTQGDLSEAVGRAGVDRSSSRQILIKLMTAVKEAHKNQQPRPAETLPVQWTGTAPPAGPLAPIAPPAAPLAPPAPVAPPAPPATAAPPAVPVPPLPLWQPPTPYATTVPLAHPAPPATTAQPAIAQPEESEDASASFDETMLEESEDASDSPDETMWEEFEDASDIPDETMLEDSDTTPDPDQDYEDAEDLLVLCSTPPPARPAADHLAAQNFGATAPPSLPTDTVPTRALQAATPAPQAAPYPLPRCEFPPGTTWGAVEMGAPYPRPFLSQMVNSGPWRPLQYGWAVPAQAPQDPSPSWPPGRPAREDSSEDDMGE
jgi:hypothetical protein